MNIVITGASRGIGYELAKKLSITGEHHVLGLARSSDKLEKLSQDILSVNEEAKFSYLSFDLLEGDIQNTLIPSLKMDFDAIDILVNNAGLLINKPFEQLTDTDFDLTFGVNVKSVFRLVREVLPLFNKNAHIINISSMGGVQGTAKFPGLSIYSASKGAVAVLTECLAEELKDKHIKVNALAIGAVQTEMLAQAFPGYKAPLTSSEMADFIADFALNGHRFFNGKILPVSVSTP